MLSDFDFGFSLTISTAREKKGSAGNRETRRVPLSFLSFLHRKRSSRIKKEKHDDTKIG